MKRKMMQNLLAWKHRTSERMPLLVYGARQVGKTHLLRAFGESYANVAYVNLETNLAVSSYFERGIDPERIVRYLEAETRTRIVPGDTLIILDEVQTCERALTSLKYFREQAPEYHIVCAGSLLGVAIHRERYSFPVGNVEAMTLFPMDFEEYLWAMDEERLAEEIRGAYDADRALPAALHERAMDLYRRYLVAGGMPRAILESRAADSLFPVSDVHQRILNDYIADMAKYASNAESVKIRAAFRSIPVQLAKENHKFQYKLAQKGGTANLFGAAIDWLAFAGIVLKCERIEQAAVPLAVYRDLSAFKLYMGDVGLLLSSSGMPPADVLAPGPMPHPFLGAIAENYVAQALAARRHALYYWTSGGTAEVDFVLQIGSDAVPVEVKSGVRTRSRSLDVFVQRHRPRYAIRVSGKNFGFENGIKSVPLYAVFCV